MHNEIGLSYIHTFDGSFSDLDAWRPTDGVLCQPGSSMNGSCTEMQTGLSSSETGIHNSTGIPPLQDLDVAVIESLPPEVVSEINDMYGGKLLGFISASKNKTINKNIHDASTKCYKGNMMVLT